jgi:hypothetical protein
MNITLAKKQLPKYKGYELPRYHVQETNGSLEIRTYESALLAELEVKGDRDKAINEGFRILAGFIFGNNLSKEKIAMTTPVVQSKVSEIIAMTTPVDQTASENGWKVHFMMPSQYSLETLPLPVDKRIQFRVTKPVKKLVIRFSGFITQSALNQQMTKLREHIKVHSLKVKDQPQYSYYDAPWTLPFMRRNEISFILE